jgi:hypothetical protein
MPFGVLLQATIRHVRLRSFSSAIKYGSEWGQIASIARATRGWRKSTIKRLHLASSTLARPLLEAFDRSRSTAPNAEACVQLSAASQTASTDISTWIQGSRNTYAATRSKIIVTYPHALTTGPARRSRRCKRLQWSSGIGGLRLNNTQTYDGRKREAGK